MRMQLATGSGLRTKVALVIFVFTRFYLQVFADLVVINLYTAADTGMARPGTCPGRIRKGEYPHNILGIVFVNEKTMYVSEYHFTNSVFQIFILIA